MITADAQQLEPGGRVTVYELDASSFGADQLFFHAHLQSGVIWWQGQEYGAWPIEATGFERTSDQPPNPRLTVGTLDGRIAAMCMLYGDLVGAKVIRRQTLVKYLDGANFPPIRNLLVNSGFEISSSGSSIATGWVANANVPSPQYSYVASDLPSSSRALRVVGTATAARQYMGVEPLQTYRPKVKPGSAYTTSVYARGAGAIEIRTTYVNSANQIVSDTGSAEIPLTGSMVRYEYAAPPAPASADKARSIIRLRAASSGQVLELVVDNAQFEEGTVPTDFQITSMDPNGDRNPTADPNEHFLDEIWFIERKVSETKEVVEFELTTAIDLNGEQLPGRQIISGVCGWLIRGGYRGPFCGYTGPAVADANDVPTTDPARDQCGGRVGSCKLRFGADKPLPYGGFPASGLLRT